VSLKTEALRENMGQCSLRAKTLREIKENMGQCESKARDFKEQKRRKTLKNREKKQSKRREVKKQQGCCASPSENLTQLTDPNFLHVCLFFVLSASPVTPS
jgi:hypothetical protein